LVFALTTTGCISLSADGPVGPMHWVRTLKK
jgi:hypothetical protein